MSSRTKHPALSVVQPLLKLGWTTDTDRKGITRVVPPPGSPHDVIKLPATADAGSRMKSLQKSVQQIVAAQAGSSPHQHPEAAPRRLAQVGRPAGGRPRR